MIELPFKVQAPRFVEPRLMLIFSNPKIGKTSALSALPNSLLIDLEDGAGYYENNSINFREQLAAFNKSQEALGKPKVSAGRYLVMLADTIRKANSDAGKPVYDFIVLDTTSALQEIAKEAALSIYKATPMGKGFTGTDVTELQQGLGYTYLRTAFDKLYDPFKGLAGKCTILSGHVKSSSIVKKGDTLTARDLDLVGKLKALLAADADAIGYLYRKGTGNENILSFMSDEQDLATGSRQEYLSGQEFVISKKENGKLITHWDMVFPSIKQ